MPDSQTAKLFQNGRSQAVRLPREFRFKGDRVRIVKTSDGVLLKPMIADVNEWFAALDRGEKADFRLRDRDQPATPSRRIFE
ncbi:MAG: type II toxin-antitoxin system VapB family antitoxin [Acidobacteriaceae bacterium]